MDTANAPVNNDTILANMTGFRESPYSSHSPVPVYGADVNEEDRKKKEEEDALAKENLEKKLKAKKIAAGLLPAEAGLPPFTAGAVNNRGTNVSVLLEKAREEQAQNKGGMSPEDLHMVVDAFTSGIGSAFMNGAVGMPGEEDDNKKKDSRRDIAKVIANNMPLPEKG